MHIFLHSGYFSAECSPRMDDDLPPPVLVKQMIKTLSVNPSNVSNKTILDTQPYQPHSVSI